MTNFGRFSLALAGSVVALASAALADGMPSQGGSIKDAPMPAPFRWTGAYIGANVGANWVNDGGLVGTPANAATAGGGGLAPCNTAGSCPFNYGPGDGLGALGGLQIGYNWQQQNIVFGIEADIQGSTANANAGVDIPRTGAFSAFSGSASTSLNYFGTVRARVGALASPTLLGYVTGGFAYGGVDRSFGGSFSQGDTYTGKSGGLETGWTVGAGAEWMLTSNITLGAEYLYVNLGAGDTLLTSNVSGACAGASRPCTLAVRGNDLENNVARVKLNFKY